MSEVISVVLLVLVLVELYYLPAHLHPPPFPSIPLLLVPASARSVSAFNGVHFPQGILEPSPEEKTRSNNNKNRMRKKYKK